MPAYNQLLLALFGLLALASNVFAARVSYVGRYSQGIGGKPGRTTRAQQISDDHVKPILNNMSSWSGGKYSASQNAKTGIVVIQNVNEVQTQAQANNVVQDQVALVCNKIKECSKPTKARREAARKNIGLI